MKNAFIFFSVCLFVSCKQDLTTSELFIIPQPVKTELSEGHFLLNEKTEIVFNSQSNGFIKTANYLQQELKNHLNLELDIIESDRINLKNAIILIQDSSKVNHPEGYLLTVSKRNITIVASEANGAFYGIQTLLQLMKVINDDKRITFSMNIPAVKIYDYPRFTYRGMHLDVCRHFFDKEFVKKYLDAMAMNKMNTFHWHLTDDQGWRIEIKKYPKLTEIGSIRKGTMIDKNWKEFDGIPHGGFYTQEDIKEVVQYAADRFITIIPEIEMPGHALAALTAYPELGCTGGPYEVEKTWGVFNDVFCAGNDGTFVFLENVLAEVIDLFPGKYIHIGGDECPKDAWKKCPKCQKRIKDEKLKDEMELQSYLVKRIENFLSSKNKRLIGWDEIIEGGLAPEATVMSWRGTEGGIHAAKLGHDVIMTPNPICYFDHYQGDPKTEPLAFGGFSDLAKVYNYEPVPAELNETEAKHILGAQANIWTEYITTPEHIEYMAMPRMCALAEVLWSKPEQKSFENFKLRLKTHVLRLKANNYNFRPLDY
ncbi:MAG: beta-N-acetylhexosaminidase [Bacteroidales bacterium]